jgi:hypothetical protein
MPLCAIAGLGACPGADFTLEDGTNRALVVTVVDGSENSRVDLFFETGARECPKAPSGVTGTLGGQTLEFGGLYEAGDHFPTKCYFHFTTKGPVTPKNGVVTVSDDSLEVRATFEVTALEQRFATHPTWSFQRGQVDAVTWSHPQDLINTAAPVASVLFDSGMIADTIPITFVPPATIMFTVPADLPVGELAMSVIARMQLEADVGIECVAATSCVARQGRGFARVVTVR